MTDFEAGTDHQSRRRAENAVPRVLAELRRGQPVVLLQDDGAVALALAAETADDAPFERLLRQNPEAALIAVTASRARALNIPPSGHDIVLVPWRPWFDLETVRGIADATTDLAQPLAGPFDREKRAPTALETAAVRLAKLARLLPAMIIVPLADAEPQVVAAADDLLLLDVALVEVYESQTTLSLRQVTSARVPLAGAENARLVAFRPGDGGIEHLAIVIGTPEPGQPVLTRLHSECFTGDLLGSLKCDCGQQLRGAIEVLASAGDGVLLYLAQEGRGIGLINKLRAYRLQEDGFDTIDANLRLGFDADERVFGPAAEMLHQLGIERVRLLTNNPEKVRGLEAAGIEVTERVPHSFPANAHNEFYLQTKRRRGGHLG